jgi:hypothetical protein
MPLRLVIRDASPYSQSRTHLADAEVLADELRRAGFGPVEVEQAPPQAGAPMASGVTEWLIVYVGAPIVSLALADLYRMCKQWVRGRITQPEQKFLKYGKCVILGPDGKPLQQFQITQLPDGTILEIEPEDFN